MSVYTEPSKRYRFTFEDKIFYDGIVSEVRNFGTEIVLTRNTGRLNQVNQAMIGTLFLINMPLALTLIKLLQFFEFFNLFNLEYPANLLVFFSLFKGGIFKFLPNVFQNLAPKTHNVNTCEPKGRMLEVGLSCSFLNNAGDFVTVILLLLSIKLGILVIKYLVNKHKARLAKK
jgi:hypothetical protein